jgi:hypothetical protein
VPGNPLSLHMYSQVTHVGAPCVPLRTSPQDRNESEAQGSGLHPITRPPILEKPQQLCYILGVKRSRPPKEQVWVVPLSLPASTCMFPCYCGPVASL